MEFWDLFVLQWHGVLLSAGAFGGEAAHIGSQVAVAEQPAVENNKGLFIYSTVSDVTLGIFRRNSGAGSSFSGMVFCCRQVLLLLVRFTSRSRR